MINKAQYRPPVTSKDLGKGVLLTGSSPIDELVSLLFLSIRGNDQRLRLQRKLS
jgi:hypothetical protein